MLTFKNLKQKIKELSGFSTASSSQSRAIVVNLRQTKAELDILNHNLNYITDPILMNQLIFQLKSTEVRYQYLFCMAKDLNITNGLSII